MTEELMFEPPRHPHPSGLERQLGQNGPMVWLVGFLFFHGDSPALLIQGAGAVMCAAACAMLVRRRFYQR